jgi:uncharacterized protein YyaL (SSP411 family)
MASDGESAQWDSAREVLGRALRGFYFTSSDHEKLPVRTKSFFDGATPSGNSAATFALLRLARLTGEATWRARAEQTLRLCRDFMEQAPYAFSYMLSAFDFYLGQ